MLKKEASAITGGLSRPSKMPCPGISLPASSCQTGQKLAQISGTPCHGCYALKGMYRFPNVQAALVRRLEALRHPAWVQAMTALIAGHEYFRWHDSGDLQSSWHLKQIFEVCNNTPDTAHWLPTQERQYLPLPGSSVPSNLLIRLSGSKINGAPPKCWPWTSTVITAKHTFKKLLYFFFKIKPILRDGSWLCPSKLPLGRAKCRSCRACWDSSILNVAYAKH